jgi:heterodisulfide reductase subunit A
MSDDQTMVRIGVYVCRWGVNIGATVDCDLVRDAVEPLSNVIVARVNDFTCSDPGQQIIKNDILELDLNRVVVAACTPKIHEPTYRAVLAEAGLSPYYFQMVNLREHCSLVHANEKKNATEKAIRLVQAGINRARELENVPRKEIPVKRSALVIGAGIAGMNAALDLANQGITVHLVEKEPTIGGKMAQLDRIYPTDDCGIWVLAPIMVNTYKHPNITLYTYSDIIEFNGIPGNYRCTIRKNARYVDETKCTGCGLCTTKCPIKVPNEFDRGIGERGAIYIPFPQAVPNYAVLDKSVCIDCKNCQRICPAEAINFDQEPEYIDINVGAVIIATGYDEYPIMETNNYNYGIYPDIITQIELERMLSPIGPTFGHVHRISDAQIPNTIVMIQCVGSRSVKELPYCSAVCCCVALKNAQLLKQEYPEMDIILFYIDIRTSDKGNEEYYRKIRDSGVRMIRGKVGEIVEDSDTKKLKIRAYSSLTGEIIKINADLVVLSTGMILSKGSADIIDIIGLSKGPDGFLTEVHGCLSPQETTNMGIYICGCAAGPKNIPYSVSTALAAASKVATLLSHDIIKQELIIAEVENSLCMGCHRCEKVCYYQAIKVGEDNIAVVDDLKCKGCGVCVTSCPARAIDLIYYRDTQFIEEIKGIGSSEIKPVQKAQKIKEN